MSTLQQPQEPEERAVPPGSDPTRDVMQPPRAATARPPYRPLAGRAAAATAALGILLVLDVAAVVAGIFEIQLLDKMAAGENVTDAQIDANDTRVGMIAVGQTVVYIACVVCFISWLHRAYENMRALSPPHPRYGSGWAVGGWFVPFLNFVRPKQIINDVYNSGRPSDPPPAWLGLWWAAFIISGFLSRFAFRGTRDDSSLEALTDTSYRYLVSDGFDVVAAVLAILVVRTLTRNQEERADTATKAPDEGAAPLPWAQPARPPEAEQAPERDRPAGPAPLG